MKLKEIGIMLGVAGLIMGIAYLATTVIHTGAKQFRTTIEWTEKVNNAIIRTRVEWEEPAPK